MELNTLITGRYTYDRNDYLSPPTTRYQGSKRKILPWLSDAFAELQFDSVLDGFGGTGSVSYLLKKMSKQVTFNDILMSNVNTGISYILNNKITLTEKDIEYIFHKNGFAYANTIADIYNGIYFTEEENKQLDIIARNIGMLSELYNGRELKIKRAIAYHCLYQAALSKRPFNLFHRSNLSLRTTEGISRSFGNKKTWERSFQELFYKFSKEHREKLISSRRKNAVTNKDIMQIRKNEFDLVYLDPPYRKNQNESAIDYQFFYHFLEGVTFYDSLFNSVDFSKKTRPVTFNRNSWSSNLSDFSKIFSRFKESIIVVSYWTPGYPTVEELSKSLSKYKNKVDVYKKKHSYSLSKSNSETYEVLIVGQ